MMTAMVYDGDGVGMRWNGVAWYGMLHGDGEHALLHDMLVARSLSITLHTHTLLTTHSLPTHSLLLLTRYALLFTLLYHIPHST